MSESQESRSERVARYKEERRRQLASQFGSRSENNGSSPLSKTRMVRDVGGSSSGSEGPRPTRASKLRLAALSHDNVNSSLGQGASRQTPEKSPTSPLTTTPISRKAERDKSSKRKSNLNRSLTSEEVPSPESIDDAKSRRRRRRFFPPEVLEQPPRQTPSEEDKKKNHLDANVTASYLPQSPTSPLTASSPTTSKPIRKTELSMHMENARRSVTPSVNELGKYKPYAKRSIASSPKTTSPRHSPAVTQSPSYTRYSLARESKSDASDIEDKSKLMASRMEALTNLTKQTLARVERLTNKARESPKMESVRKPTTSSPIRHVDAKTYGKSYTRKSPSVEKSMPSSILKKKSLEETPPQVTVEPTSIVSAGPVSILKRKPSQDDHNKLEGAHSSTHTPPVTFSPSVVEPSTSKRKQGILKRRSLDESTVMRHRSCSPDVANKTDSRSILKNQRRSSLEELRRTQSPEIHLHGILKRKSSRTDEEDQSLNSPQGILKRRSGASSAGSVANTPHVSITTAVILAAAGGAEMVLQPETEPVRPILKKKSSDDHPHSDVPSEGPKPILKKKSSTDTDEAEEKPRPILKLPKSSMERETLDTGQETRETRSFKYVSSSETECEVRRPILKQSTSREESPRPRLSFCAESSSLDEDVMRQRTSRRSHTICTDFNVESLKITTREEDRLLKKARPMSVHELVKSFESSCSTGAIPKRSSLKRNSDRYRTQPVTSIELEESRNLVKSPQFKDEHSINHSNRSFDVQSLLDFTTSLENDSNLNSFFSSPLRNQPSPESFACTKMSSDSAFQSLGDGLELEQEDELPSASSETVPQETEQDYSLAKPKSKLEPTKLEFQMKAIAEEAKKMRLGKGNAGIDRYKSRKSGVSDRFPSRFSTQPVTFEEVQEASRFGTATTVDESGDDENDPSKMSLMDRIRLFEKSPTTTKMRRCRARFSTEIVGADEIASARSFFSENTTAFALDDLDASKSSERKSILKLPPVNTVPKRPVAERKTLSPPAPKSALKKRESWGGSSRTTTATKPVIKVETSPDKDDEGISCNDSASDTDSSVGCDLNKSSGKVLGTRIGNDSTSEGESSGGREIKSIFRNEKKLNFKLKLENVLSKSKSYNAFDDTDVSLLAPKKKVTVRRSHTENEMPQSIADLRAKLKERGESDWRKRVPLSNNATDELKLLKEKNRYNDELSEKSLLATKKDELDASSRQWKSRVEKSDAEKFSVAGKMSEKIRDATPTINIKDVDENEKRTPQAKRFKLKGTDSTPGSPEKGSIFDLTRSKSVPYSPVSDLDKIENNDKTTPKKVSVPNPDDITFKNFFKSFEQLNNNNNVETVDVSQEDFDSVERQSLLVIRKNVQVQKRRGATRNPIKALATRTDITNEYTEVITGVAEREKKRLNIEKLAKNSNKALEALAGLASNEDFKSVALRKSPTTIGLLPWKDLMLLQIKGRRHVQTRLIEPIASNINEGDNFILITPNALYNYVGAYSNIIEQSRAADVANHIQKTGDMGCKVSKIITINNKDSSPKHTAEFWRLLGANKPPDTIIGAGHPDEDETYEANILRTNMIYIWENDELVPHDKYWGTIPKIEILNETSILVFDFGSEMYMWSGKNAPFDKKKETLSLARKLWEEGYDYTDCNVCPLNVASLMGDRKQESLPLECDRRPDWALFSKITQHRETVLFKEKFLDWPDFSRVIRVRSDDSIKEVNASYDIKPCDVDEMLKEKEKDPDLVVDNIHLGRGHSYWDEESRRLFEYETQEIKGWRILENTYEQLKEKSLGQFYDGDSYIYCWNFKQTVKGRELGGLPSKRAPVGRDRCIFFCWQGIHSSINEKGTAACLTVELDKQSAPQVRVEQGSEPAAFLRLFDGNMVTHKGKRDEVENTDTPRMFILRGEVENEIYLMEVPLKMSSLRSRSSFVIINTETDQISLWHGSKSSKQKRKVIKDTVDKLMKTKPEELYLDVYEEDLDIVEMEEGSESEDFFDALGNDRDSYVSLLDCDDKFDYTIRLFNLSSVTGSYVSTEVLCPHRSEHSSPYPFVQSELYSARQPALFLLDNHYELWLWQGWWPETEEELDVLSDQTGSGAVRWQAERKAAMQTAVNYWKKLHGDDKPVVGYLVWAGMEPLKFKNLFPAWEDREDVMELNKKDGRNLGDMIPLENELAQLSRSTYPLDELLQRPLPEGVDPTHIEKYLSPDDFEELLSMSKEDFEKLPSWKKTALKKEKGLF